ncbi:MAG: hypothetical protein MJ053_02615 [Elusimicrobiaceae bacterium]|nr:hypothetical protein [Elusimicrobiaceae bacterium]
MRKLTTLLGTLIVAVLLVPAASYAKTTIPAARAKAAAPRSSAKAQPRSATAAFVQQKLDRATSEAETSDSSFRYAGPCEKAPKIKFAGNNLLLRCDFSGGVFSETQTSNVYYLDTHKYRREDVALLITWDLDWLKAPWAEDGYNVIWRDDCINTAKTDFSTKDAYELIEFSDGNVIMSGYNNDQDYHRGWLRIYRTFDQGEVYFELRVPSQLENDAKAKEQWREQIVNEAAHFSIPSPYDMHQ